MTEAEIAQLRQRLSEAETAYHQLVLGAKAAVIVDSNGERIEFQAANAARLMAYIQDLKRQLGLSSSGPMTVWFR